MEPQPIYSSPSRRMRLGIFMSGSGSNAIRMLEKSREPDSNYDVVLIFSDVKDTRTRGGRKMCRAKDIAEEWGVAYESLDIRDFYSERGLKRSDLSVRPEFDRLVLDLVRPYQLDLIANAGYMSIMSTPLLEEFDGRIVNVHPADLRLVEGGRRKYVGIHVVRDAILAGEKELRSTTHIVREEVDHGEILVVSEPVEVRLEHGLEELLRDRELLESVVSSHQQRLKEKGDWVIYPLTIQFISQGRFALLDGVVYLDGEPLPEGLVLGG